MVIGRGSAFVIWIRSDFRVFSPIERRYCFSGGRPRVTAFFEAQNIAGDILGLVVHEFGIRHPHR